MWIQFFLQGFGRHIQDVAHEMRLAPLPGDALKVPADGSNQSSLVIRHKQINASKPAAFQPANKFTPTDFQLAVAKHQAQYLAISVGVDTNPDKSASGPHSTFFPHF